MKRWKKLLIGVVVVMAVGMIALMIRYKSLGVEVKVDEAKLSAVPAAAVATEFTTVTYNVQARPLMDDPVHKFTRMPKVLQPFDIVSFQEMFTDHARMYAGLTHPVQVYHATLNTPFKIVGSGLGTVGRFPLAGVEAMNFSTAGEAQNVPASKGVLLTRFKVGGLPLDVYTTHMEAGHKSEYSMVARRIQAAELVAFVQQKSSPESAIIVQGDFNMRHSKPEQMDPETAAGNPTPGFVKLTRYQVLTAMCVSLGLKDLSKEVQGSYFDAPDHILFRSGLKAELTPLSWQHDAPEFYDEDKKELSDHSPLIGKFRISPR